MTLNRAYVLYTLVLYAFLGLSWDMGCCPNFMVHFVLKVEVNRGEVMSSLFLFHRGWLLDLTVSTHSLRFPSGRSQGSEQHHVLKATAGHVVMDLLLLACGHHNLWVIELLRRGTLEFWFAFALAQKCHCVRVLK